MNLCSFYILTFVQLLLTSTSSSDKTLKSLHVVFRHGDRTPDFSYPTDLYKNETYYPEGLSSITNQGKRRLYDFGRSLRDKYDDFLGEIYYPSDVKAITTNFSRTKMSLHQALAGLYPPKGRQVWNKHLNWQPIPMKHLSYEENISFLAIYCPKFQEEFKRVEESEKFKNDVLQFDEFFKNVSTILGRKVSPGYIYLLHTCLSSQYYMNLTLPEWTKSYFPKGYITDVALFEYRSMSYNSKLKRIAGGLPLRMVLDDINVVMNNDTSVKKPKVHLYSGHDHIVSNVLNTLNVWKREIPEYTSAVIIELYEENFKYFVKFLYYKGIPVEYEERRIPGCSKFCRLEEFIRITKDFIPDDILQECFGSNRQKSGKYNSIDDLLKFFGV